MKLYEVLNIFLTECGAFLSNGMGFSEPIMTIENGVLIDNFFVFLADKELRMVSKPFAAVGIDSKAKTLVYRHMWNVSTNYVASEYISVKPQTIISKERYIAYAELYEKIREIAYKQDLDEPEKQLLKAYISSLKDIVGYYIFPLYEELAPAFFEWSQRELT